MPHAPGVTLIKVQVLYSRAASHDVWENVLHFRSNAAPASLDNSNLIAEALATYYETVIADLISTAGVFTGIIAEMDDGVNKFAGSFLDEVAGTIGGDLLPDVMCAIVRKIGGGSARGRFGHICHPALAESMMEGPNDFAAPERAALDAFYRGMISFVVADPVGTINMVLYNPVTDVLTDVIEVQTQRLIKTQRRRTPGRGI